MLVAWCRPSIAAVTSRVRGHHLGQQKRHAAIFLSYKGEPVTVRVSVRVSMSVSVRVSVRVSVIASVLPLQINSTKMAY